VVNSKRWAGQFAPSLKLNVPYRTEEVLSHLAISSRNGLAGPRITFRQSPEVVEHFNLWSSHTQSLAAHYLREDWDLTPEIALRCRDTKRDHRRWCWTSPATFYTIALFRLYFLSHARGAYLHFDDRFRTLWEISKGLLSATSRARQTSTGLSTTSLLRRPRASSNDWSSSTYVRMLKDEVGDFEGNMPSLGRGSSQIDVKFILAFGLVLHQPPKYALPRARGHGERRTFY
jgi:hypothetical protein